MTAEQPPELRFNANGKFTILQVSDVQDSNGLLPRTRELYLAAIERARPDFVVFTGDQIKGYGLSLLMAATPYQQTLRLARTINELAGPLAARQIPFTITFGNHDHDAPLDGPAQIELYKRWPNCMVQHTQDVPGYANHALPLYPAKGKKPAMLLYFVDTHGPSGFGYTALDPKQIDWYRATRDAYAAQNGGAPLPGILFQHVPLEEIIELYREVPAKTPGALEGFRNYKGRFFVIDEDKVAPGSFMGELPSSPDKNAGLFDAALERGDMAAMFFGHDHNNGFHGAVRGIQLGYAPAAGYSAYGPGRQRGVRVITLNQADPRAIESYVLTDGELLGPDNKLSLRVNMQDRTPSSFGAAKPLIRRSLTALALGTACAGAIAAAAVTASKVKKRRMIRT